MAEKEDAPPEIKEKIRDLAAQGKIGFGKVGQKYFDDGKVFDFSKPDLTLTDVNIESIWGEWEKNKGGFRISWSSVSAGFGEFTLWITKEGKVEIDSETMSKEFCLGIFSKLLDKGTFV